MRDQTELAASAWFYVVVDVAPARRVGGALQQATSLRVHVTRM